MEAPLAPRPPWPSPSAAPPGAPVAAAGAPPGPAPASPVAGLSAAEWQAAREQAAQWHASRRAMEWHTLQRQAPQTTSWGTPGPWMAAPAGPSKRHRRWAVVVAGIVLLAMVAAATAMVLVRRDHDEAATYSFETAKLEAGAARSLTYEIDMTTADRPEVHATASIDLERQLATMTVDDGRAEWDYVMDLGESVVYVDSDPLDDLGFDVGDADWVSFDMDEAMASEGLTGVYGLGDNPLDTTTLFDQAESVDDLGLEQLHGEQVRHYEVTMDAGTVTAGSTLRRNSLVNDGDADPEGKLVYDVYVDEWNEIVRLSFAAKVADQWVSVDLNVTSIDEPVDIDVPRPSSVVSWDDVGGDF